LIEGDNGEDAVVVVVEVVVASVDVELVVVAPVKVASVEVESLGAVVVSVAVDVLSVVPVIPETIPMAPEASIPAQSSAPNPRTIPARRSVFRPFISPAPLLPR